MSSSSKLTLIAGALLMAGIGASAMAPTTRDVGGSRVLYADPVLHAPKASQALQVTVQSSVSYDPITRMYTYAYQVTNEATSSSALHSFGLSPLPAPVSMGVPPHWDGSQPWEGDSTLAGWTVADNDTGPLPPDDTGNIYQSPYDLSPGGLLAGFTLLSRNPPTTVQFFAQGFDTLPTGDSDEPPPSLSQEGVTGNITGPDINAVVGVEDQAPSHDGIAFRPPAPNPARGAVSLVFELPERSRILLEVIDVKGRRIRTLAQGFRDRGMHTVSWNGLGDSGERSPAGVYFIRLSANGRMIDRRRVSIVR
jgi:hypothetical protein